MNVENFFYKLDNALECVQAMARWHEKYLTTSYFTFCELYPVFICSM